MVRISACVIAKNERENIERCLQSVKPIVNEMIVVDTGSTDNTMAIAQAIGAKVFHFEWRNDFSAARNYALKQAKGDWVIFLDADEYIRSDKVINVRPFIEIVHANRKIEAVVCLMENTEGVDGSLRTINPTVRIFRNLPKIRYSGAIHEGVNNNGEPLVSVRDSDKFIVIRHTGYTETSRDQKLKRNLIILENELANNRFGLLNYYYVSDTYGRFGEYEKAIVFASKALEHGMVTKSMFAYRPYVIMATCMMKLGTYTDEEIGAVIDEAIGKFPHHPEVLWIKGLHCWKLDRYTKALTFFLQAIKANDEYSDLSLNNNFQLEIATVYRDTAVLYALLDQPLEAMEYNVRALRLKRYDEKAFQGLLSIIRSQQPDEIVYLLNSIYDNGKEEDIQFLVLQLARQKVKKVLSYYYHIWSEVFGHDDFGGIVTLLTENRMEQAYSLFAEYFRETNDYGGEMLAIVTMLLGGNPDWFKWLGPKAKLSFAKITAQYFYGGDKTGDILSYDDFEAYSDLIADFGLLCDDEQINNLLKVGKNFPQHNALEQAGDVLFNQRLFSYTLLFYKEQIFSGKAESESLGFLYRKTGYCYYRLKDYDEAIRYFEQAFAAGYAGNDLWEYLELINKKCRNGDLKKRINSLLRGCSKNL